MKYYLGVDVGQSSTRAVLCDAEGHILLRGKAGGYNRPYEPGGIAQLKEVLQALWCSLWPDGRAEDLVLEAIAFGMSAGWEQIPQVKNLLPPHRALVAQWDGITALRGAIGLQPGIVVIAGTGAVGIAMDEQKRMERCGGWGWRIDDAGSAYDIGLQAIRLAMRAHDGRAPASALQTVVLQHFGKEDYYALKADAMAGTLGVDDIAALSRVVSAQAARGDLACADILRRAGYELALLPEALLRRAGVEVWPVAYVGGVFADPIVREAFTQTLAQRCPGAVVMPGRHSPLIGALLLAYEAAGCAVTQAMLLKWDQAQA